MSIEIIMPTLSPTMTKGMIAAWCVAVGDDVKTGDVIFEVETDKVTIEVEANECGVVADICTPEGGEAAVGAVIMKMVKPGQQVAAVATSTVDKLTAPINQPINQPDNQQANQPAKLSESSNVTDIVAAKAVAHSESANKHIHLTPLARRMVAQENIDISQLKGSGNKGRILKQDIEKLLGFDPSQAITAPAALPATLLQPTAPVIDYATLPAYREIKNSAMRDVVATRLSESSREVPHFHLSVDCEIDALLTLRRELNDREQADYKISVNDFVIKAVAHAMKKVPAANCMWAGDSVLEFEQVDISIAVAVTDGLITPIVKNVNAKGLADISHATKQLVSAARAGKLQPGDYQGGTFTISNLGMFGIKEFTSIINSPQNGILSIGAAEKRAVVKNDELAIATVMTVTLAMDHRCVDGAVGAQFIAAFKLAIEQPITLML